LKNANPSSFQPMNINLGLFPPLPQKIKDRRKRCEFIAQKALSLLEVFMKAHENVFCS